MQRRFQIQNKLPQWGPSHVRGEMGGGLLGEDLSSLGGAPFSSTTVGASAVTYLLHRVKTVQKGNEEIAAPIGSVSEIPRAVKYAAQLIFCSTFTQHKAD